MTDMNVDAAKTQREKPRKSKSSSTNRKINLKDYHPKIQKLFQGKEHKLRMIGNWVVGETLGMGGYSKVKLGLHKETGQKAALKIMFADQTGRVSDSKKRQLFRELNVMKKVEHPNVVHLYEYDAEAEYPEANGSSTPCIMSALEFAAGGELFDYLMYTGHFDSRATRTYFGQLISGLKAMHEAGIAHRDLKPENLLMDSSFTLKIADFGFATQFRDEKGRQHLMKTPCGTKNYLAPEFWKGQQYSYKCDIFACGIILFTIYAGFPPFMEAQPKDWWWDKYMWAVKYRAKAASMSADEAVQANKFRAEADRRMKLFWKAHTKKRQFDDDDFKELALNLIHPSARQRYDLKQIQDHQWMTKGPTYSKNELKHYLGKRVRLVLRQRAKKIRNMMMTKNVQPVRQEHVVRSFSDLSPMQKRALELDPQGEFLKNVLSVSDDLIVQSAFQFMTFVAPAEMAARLERAITVMGGLCNVTPEENEILIKMKLKFSQPNADKTFVQTTDECVISVRLYLLGDRKDAESKEQAETKEQTETSDATVDAAQTVTKTETTETNTNTNSNSNNDDDSKEEEYDEAAVAHDRNWLITFKRLRGQHSTYCSLVEKLLFHEDVSPALRWKEMEEIQDNEPENYELHDFVEECENVKTTVLENEDNINAEIVTDKNI